MGGYLSGSWIKSTLPYTDRLPVRVTSSGDRSGCWTSLVLRTLLSTGDLALVAVSVLVS